MEASGQHDQQQRTLAAQPAAAAHVGVLASLGDWVPTGIDAPRDVRGGPARTRLERILLAARQMQQH